MAASREKVLEQQRSSADGIAISATSSQNPATLAINVKRYMPGKSEQFFQSYELRFQNELTVLDALNDIKDTKDGTLTFRYSCKMGICGSCSAMVNGRPVLMCQTYCKDLTSPIRVEPLRNFPVIKDLVVDITDGFEKMKSVNPYLERIEKRALKEGEYLQTPKEREALDQTSQCIKCMLCYSACPVYGMDKNFIGPAAGALAYRYQADSRDQGKEKRIDKIIGEKGVWNCSFVGECSAVCPKRVDPALALQRLKLMGALRLGKRLVGDEALSGEQAGKQAVTGDAQKTSSFWWTRNPRTLVYFFRELTGVFIALYTMVFLCLAFFDSTLSFVHETAFSFISFIGLVAAIFHAITWFWVTITISPVTLPFPDKIGGFISLIAVWIVVSHLLLRFLYVA